MHASNKYATQMPQIWYMPQLLDKHVWGKYANIHAKYKVASINGVGRFTEHR